MIKSMSERAEPIRVSLVEDDAIIREDLSVLLSGCPEVRLIQCYRSAEEALENIWKAQPDVLLVDINLPGASGIECVRRLKLGFPTIQFLMLTVYEDAERVFESLKAGATGYLVKRCSRLQLLGAIADVRSGGAPMSSHIARKVVQFFFRQERPDTAAKSQVASLSQREHEVLQALAGGLLYKEIADQLQISVDTVRKHIANIYSKLRVHSRTEAVVKFLRKPPF